LQKDSFGRLLRLPSVHTEKYCLVGRDAVWVCLIPIICQVVLFVVLMSNIYGQVVYCEVTYDTALNSFVHSLCCLPYDRSILLPKPVLRRVRSSGSCLHLKYPLVSRSSNGRSIATSLASSTQCAIQCFFFQFPVSCRFLEVIHYLLTSSSSSSCPFYPSLYFPLIMCFRRQFLRKM
jgi:hypothetical protein